jgi:hypothetical protein
MFSVVLVAVASSRERTSTGTGNSFVYPFASSTQPSRSAHRPRRRVSPDYKLVSAA